MIIYMARNRINNKVYIGQTKRTLEERKYQHIGIALSGNGFRFHDAIRKYGVDNFEWSTLEVVSSLDKLDERELYWIKYYNSYNTGYNSTPGNTNPMHCEDIKKHHDEIMRSKEIRDKISKSMKQRIAEGKFFSEEHRKKISEKLKGNKHFLGHTRTPEAIEMTAKGTRKKVVCYDFQTGNKVNEFDSVKSASQWLYSDRCADLKRWQNLMNAIKHSSVTGKPYRGLLWKYI